MKLFNYYNAVVAIVPPDRKSLIPQLMHSVFDSHRGARFTIHLECGSGDKVVLSVSSPEGIKDNVVEGLWNVWRNCEVA